MYTYHTHCVTVSNHINISFSLILMNTNEINELFSKVHGKLMQNLNWNFGLIVKSTWDFNTVFSIFHKGMKFHQPTRFDF